MADTRRTRAELLASLADNSTGDISAQDLRDFLVTIMGGYASLKTVDGTTAQGSINATPAKVTTWDTNGAANGLIPDHTTDDITVDVSGVYFVECDISFSGSGNSTFQVHLRVDGVEADEGFHRKIGSGGDTGSAGFHGIVSLTAAEVLTVYIESQDGGTTITPSDAQFSAHQIA